MKLKLIRSKKGMMAASFFLGALLLATTSFADITASTGYDQLKQSFKNTTAALDGKLQSYTVEVAMSLKDNGKLLTTEDTITRVNSSEKKMERISSMQYANGEKTDTFSYEDNRTSIQKYSGSDVYSVAEYTSDHNIRPFGDPFKEERAADMEKILDALVGNLSNYVVMEKTSDGGREFSGSLGEAQIPTLANAVCSFIVKEQALQSGRNSAQMPMPQITSDVFIKNISGKATANSDNILENLLATCVLSGIDKQGTSHDLTLEMLMKVSDINATTVQKPDLTGKKVEKHTEKVMDSKTISTKYIGAYKNDIVTEKDGQYVKLGERHLEITGIDGQHITGHYYETYKPEYAAEYEKDKVEFRFDAEIMDGYRAQFSYTNGEFNLTELYLSDGGKVTACLGGGAPQGFDFQFVRDFE